jgi:hypothetical protein
MFHIALTVDDASLQQFPFVIQSIHQSLINQSLIQYYLIATGHDTQSAKRLRRSVVRIINHCFSDITKQVHVISFYLPHESGFYRQIQSLKNIHHWTSPIGESLVTCFAIAL